MSRTAWIVAIAAGLGVLAILVWLGMGVFRAPVYNFGARVCVGCVETHTAYASDVRAGSLSGTYRFRRDSEWMVRFEDGSVAHEGAELDPGCTVGSAAAGDGMAFDGATDVRFRVPAPDDACA